VGKNGLQTSSDLQQPITSSVFYHGSNGKPTGGPLSETFHEAEQGPD
jgi:hypothetical protein